jgi:thiamine biosynthesis lipoprotein
MLVGLRDAARRAIGAAADGGAGTPARVGAWYSREAAIMGTSIRVELWERDAAAAAAAMTEVMDEMHRIDRAMSPHKPDSELSRINRDAAAGPVATSPEMCRLLARALDYSRLSDGAFDITFASVGRLYDYRERVRPDAAALAQARAAIGYRHLEVDEQAGTVRFGRPGMCIDLGGFAKGHAVENAAGLLRRRGIDQAIVTAGGDSRLLGDHGGRPWTIGVRDPRRPGELAAVLPLRDVAVSTSGDYERYFEEDGVRFHHILDPRTGVSPDRVRSVTTIAADGLASEALSKCVFVLGVADGLRLVQSQPGADAVVVDAAGALHFSAGLRPAAQPGTPLARQPFFPKAESSAKKVKV